MNILMLAPQPFFQPRGTPISVYFRIKALSMLGHKIDLVTYHLGQNVDIKNLKIIRIPDFWGLREIKIGPSYAKIPLDFLLFWLAWGRLFQKKYDLIFSHEEAALIGIFLSKFWKIPHVYDMHSSLPQQLKNYNFSHSPFLEKIFLSLEKFILRHSQAVIAICPDLMKKIESKGFAEKAVLLENFLEFEHPPCTSQEIQKKRQEIAPPHHKIILYAGNFQPYQGIPLLLEACSLLKDKKIVLLLIGEKGRKLEEAKSKAEQLNLSKNTKFMGQLPPSQLSVFISLADVLVSPRISGSNTPLKIYSFLKSGKPVVATKLWTHTQVLNPQISILVQPNPQSLAQGLNFALFNQEAQKKASQAKIWSANHYTLSHYLEKINHTLRLATQEMKPK